MPQEILIQSLEDLPRALKVFLEYIGDRKKLCFSGQLGAGKTTFIKEFCKHFQVREEAVSPTYSIINEYSYLENEQEKNLYHMDLYRLKSPEEAFDIGIEDYLFNDSYVLIEWFEIIEDWLPEEAVIIKIELLPDFSRKMVFL